jgi:hypothetical protein
MPLYKALHRARKELFKSQWEGKHKADFAAPVYWTTKPLTTSTIWSLPGHDDILCKYQQIGRQSLLIAFETYSTSIEYEQADASDQQRARSLKDACTWFAIDEGDVGSYVKLASSILEYQIQGIGATLAIRVTRDWLRGGIRAWNEQLASQSPSFSTMSEQYWVTTSAPSALSLHWSGICASYPHLLVLLGDFPADEDEAFWAPLATRQAQGLGLVLISHSPVHPLLENAVTAHRMDSNLNDTLSSRISMPIVGCCVFSP